MLNQSRIICFYNNKGGVGKTTITAHICEKLIDNNKKVLVIDTDTQLNLSTFLLRKMKDEDGEFIYNNDTIYRFWENITTQNMILNDNTNTILVQWLKCLNQIFDINSYNPIIVNDNLHFIPSDPRMFFIEQYIVQALYNVVPNISYLRSFRVFLLNLQMKHNYDYILIDLSPSADIVNQNILLSSDYWVLPSYYDNYSMITYKNLSTWLQQWYVTHSSYLNNFKQPIKFCCIVTSRFSKMKGDIAKYFKLYDSIIEQYRSQFLNILTTMNMNYQNFEMFQIQDYKMLMVAFNLSNVASYKIETNDVKGFGLKHSFNGGVYGTHKYEINIIYDKMYNLFNNLPKV